MSHTIDSIDIRGLRKSHLRQLAALIYARDNDENKWYYGNREQFEKRQVDLRRIADWLCHVADDQGTKIAKTIP